LTLALCDLHKEALRRTDAMGLYDFMLALIIIMVIVISIKK
jgi:hypothetical protein